MDVKGKVALVTGGASGIGLATVKELLKNGAKGIVMADYNKIMGIEAFNSVSSEFGKDSVVFIKTDIKNEESFEAAFKKAITTFEQLDIVINNAGIMNDVDYELCIQTNLIGTIRGTLLGIKYMGKNRNQSGGVVINVASIAAVCKTHEYTTPVYSSTKAGIIKMSQGFGNNFHVNTTGVKVIVVCPGATNTPLHQSVKFFDGCLEECAKFYKNKIFQTPDTIARSIVYILQNGDSKSIWLVEENNLYIINDIDVLEKHKKLITSDI